MDAIQIIVNVLLGIASAALGWAMKVIWDSLSRLQKADQELAAKVASIEVLVAGNYVTRAEWREELGGLHTKLDRVLEALNKKMDRR